MKFALIHGGVVANIVLWDGNTASWAPESGVSAVKLEEYSPVMIGDHYDGVVFSTSLTADFPALTLEQVKAAQVSALGRAFSLRMAVIKADYPDDEIQSWFQQSAEAVAYTASKTAPTPLLSSMALARGITVADLAARVITNSAAYAAAAGTLIGKRQKYEDAVKAAADAAAVSANAWAD